MGLIKIIKDKLKEKLCKDKETDKEDKVDDENKLKNRAGDGKNENLL